MGAKRGSRAVFSGDDGDLKAILERGGGTWAGREGRVEMAEVERVWQAVGFAGRIGAHAKPGE